MNPIVLVGLVMAVYSVSQYRKYRERSRLMFSAFWGFLAAAAATGTPLLYIPVVAFLGLGIYCRFVVKDKWMKETRTLLEEEGVTDEDLEQTGEEFRGEEKQKELDDLTREAKRRQKEAARAEFTATQVRGFTEISFQNMKEISFPADSNKKLSMDMGEINASIQMNFRPERAENDEVDTLIFEMRIADNTGAVWECRAFLEPHVMTDLLRADTADPSSGFVLWSEAPSSWKDAIKNECLIADVLNLLDGRDANEIRLGENTYNVYFKHQGPRIDVGYLDGAASFIVRISDLYHDVYEGDRFIDRREVPPFCFEMASDQFLFLSSPEYYYSYYEEWYDIDQGKEKEPLAFRKTQAQGTPQPHVRLAAA
jgi:hypothetical protein